LAADSDGGDRDDQGEQADPGGYEERAGKAGRQGVIVDGRGHGGAAEVTVDGVEPRQVILYFHGGVYVFGDAFQAAGLAAQIAQRTRAKVISVDYRLAPEHPYPAAVDDALAAYAALLQAGTDPADIALAGESAGGGLAIATLVSARDRGLPQPAAAYVMSPPPGCPTCSRRITRSSTRRPRRWTGPGSFCRPSFCRPSYERGAAHHSGARAQAGVKSREENPRGGVGSGPGCS
jgi:acetyl esterase/lipase